MGIVDEPELYNKVFLNLKMRKFGRQSVGISRIPPGISKVF